jgi:hypothetical protein
VSAGKVVREVGHATEAPVLGIPRREHVHLHEHVDDGDYFAVSESRRDCALNPRNIRTNLLLNAVAYGGPKITAFVRDFAEECVVDVQDSGPRYPSSIEGR